MSRSCHPNKQGCLTRYDSCSLAVTTKQRVHPHLARLTTNAVVYGDDADDSLDDASDQNRRTSVNDIIANGNAA